MCMGVHAPGDAGQIGNYIEEVIIWHFTEARILWEGDDGGTIFSSPPCNTKQADKAFTTQPSWWKSLFSLIVSCILSLFDVLVPLHWSYMMHSISFHLHHSLCGLKHWDLQWAKFAVVADAFQPRCRADKMFIYSKHHPKPGKWNSIIHIHKTTYWKLFPGTAIPTDIH